MKIERIQSPVQGKAITSGDSATSSTRTHSAGDRLTISDNSENKQKRKFYRAPVYTKKSTVEEPTAEVASTDSQQNAQATQDSVAELDVTA